MGIEKMNDFFTARIAGYDENMLNADWGYKEGCLEIAKYIPSNIEYLLDLGCGTGLELDEIFKLYPDVEVTGIDLTQVMLDKLKEKYSNRNIKLICDSYFNVDLGKEAYNTVISCETLHHFSHEDKLKLYSGIQKALKPNGRYIECDYMVIEQSEEEHYFAENKRIRAEQGIADGEFYHYDTPCTIENQINLFLSAGFKEVRQVFRMENTTIIIADK
jgi:SAM-dependent methyltransferase